MVQLLIKSLSLPHLRFLNHLVGSCIFKSLSQEVLKLCLCCPWARTTARSHHICWMWPPQCRREERVMKGKDQVLCAATSAQPHRCPSGHLWLRDHSVLALSQWPKREFKRETVYVSSHSLGICLSPRPSGSLLAVLPIFRLLKLD